MKTKQCEQSDDAMTVMLALRSPSAAFRHAAMMSSYDASFTRRTVRSTTLTSTVGTCTQLRSNQRKSSFILHAAVHSLALELCHCWVVHLVACNVGSSCSSSFFSCLQTEVQLILSLFSQDRISWQNLMAGSVLAGSVLWEVPGCQALHALNITSNCACSKGQHKAA